MSEHNHDHHDHGDHKHHDHNHDHGSKPKRNWAAIVIVGACAIIFLISSMTFTVSNSEHVIVKRFGSFSKVASEGLNFKWPYPIDDVARIDKRIQHFERPLTQTALADVRNLLVSVSAGWKVTDPKIFLESVNNIDGAAGVMKNIIGTPTGNVFPKYKLNEVFNTDEKAHKIDKIKEEILAGAKERAKKYGIDVVYVGFTQLAFAPSATTAVLNRMKSERKVIAEKYRNQGKEKAEEIIRNAKRDARQREVTAEIEAEKIRRQADFEVADIYKKFENPELVALLKQLDSLKKVLDNKTQMVIDLNTPPFNLMKGDFFEDLKKKSEQKKK
ncbi:MAG: protease modulator HflC [Lentisphaeraceae bacterium]|nr:protease modulator HflC [Lentisphaeraceae bacterium]